MKKAIKHTDLIYLKLVLFNRYSKLCCKHLLISLANTSVNQYRQQSEILCCLLSMPTVPGLVKLMSQTNTWLYSSQVPYKMWEDVYCQLWLTHTVYFSCSLLTFLFYCPPVDQIEKIFMMAQKQRNWDHFTKAQRKNVELWLRQAKVGAPKDCWWLAAELNALMCSFYCRSSTNCPIAWRHVVWWFYTERACMADLTDNVECITFTKNYFNS